MNPHQTGALRSLLAPLDRAPDDLGSKLAVDDRELLLESILSEPPTPSIARPRHRKAIALGLTVTVAAGTAAAGWTLTRPSVRLSTGLECEIYGGSAGESDSIIQPTTGDPVVDCSAEWLRETGKAAPPLRAYDGGHGGIFVAPASEKQPAQLVPLAPGVAQDVRATTLQNMADDVLAGLDSRCFSTADATTVIRNDLAALDLQRWTIKIRDRADGDGSCASAVVAPDGAPSVTMIAGAFGYPATVGISRNLASAAARVESECGDLATTASRLRSAAAALGQTEAASQFTVDQVIDPTARCTTIVMDVGGEYFFHLRGPA